jgi:guanine deaminase
VVSTHISENVEEIRATLTRFATPDYLAVYERAGLLGRRTVLAHCIHLTGSEWQRVAAAGAVVAHCPDSNAFLGSGTMPVGEVLDRGIAMVAGSDVAAGRSFCMRSALAHVHDNALRAGRRVTPEWLFRLGTLGGARALGFAQVGAIAPGFEADLVVHRGRGLDPALGSDRVLGSLLFATHDVVVDRVFVRGRALNVGSGAASDVASL